MPNAGKLRMRFRTLIDEQQGITEAAMIREAQIITRARKVRVSHLVEVTGLAQSSISHWLAGRRPLPWSALADIEDWLDR